MCDFEWALGVGITAKPGQPCPLIPSASVKGAKPLTEITMEEKKLTPSDLGVKLPPVEADNKFGTSGRTSQSTYRDGWTTTDFDSWDD